MAVAISSLYLGESPAGLEGYEFASIGKDIGLMSIEGLSAISLDSGFNPTSWEDM